MAQAPRDQNRVTTLLGASNIDGSTPVVIWADPSTHELLVKASVSITPSGTQDVNITKVGGSVIALGQAAMASSFPVVISSDQSAIAVTLTSTTITGTVAVTQSTSPWVVAGNAAAGASDSGNPVKVGGVFNTTPTVLTTGQRGDIQLDTQGHQEVSLSLTSVNSSVNQINGSAADGVSNTLSTYKFINYPFIFNGTTWDRARTIIDATNSVGTGITAVGNLAQFNDVSPTAITENQFGNLRMSANRNLYGTIRDAAGNERGANVDSNNNLQVGQATAANLNATVVQGTGTNLHTVLDSGTLTTLTTVTTVSTVTNVATIGTSVTPGTAAANLGKAEDVANAGGDTGVFTLGVRNDTLLDTTNTTGDYSQMSTDIKGRVMTAGAPRPLKVNQITTITTSTAETTVFTAVGSTFLDVYGVIVVNSSATASNIAFKDSTAGTTRFNIYVPAGDTRGFMLPVDSAITQTTINNNWTATSSASVTSIIITMLAVKMV